VLVLLEIGDGRSVRVQWKLVGRFPFGGLVWGAAPCLFGRARDFADKGLSDDKRVPGRSWAMGEETKQPSSPAARSSESCDLTLAMACDADWGVIGGKSGCRSPGAATGSPLVPEQWVRWALGEVGAALWVWCQAHDATNLGVTCT